MATVKTSISELDRESLATQDWLLLEYDGGPIRSDTLEALVSLGYDGIFNYETSGGFSSVGLFDKGCGGMGILEECHWNDSAGKWQSISDPQHQQDYLGNPKMGFERKWTSGLDEYNQYEKGLKH